MSCAVGRVLGAGSPVGSGFRKGWAANDALAQSEVPVDPSLPQLGTMLDSGKMASLLSSHMSGGLFGSQYEIAGCRVANVRYRPGLKCQVSYFLDIRGDREGSGKAQIVTVSTVNKHRAASRLPRQLDMARRNGVLFGYLPARGMVVTTFPYDLGLHQLHTVFANGTHDVHARLSCHDDLSSSVVSYRPERSCLVRGRTTHESSEASELCFARMYADDRGERVFDAMRALWDSQARRDGVVSVAEPLGYDRALRILYQGVMPGVSPPGVEAVGTFFRHSRSIALSLAAIHRSPVLVDEPRSPDELLRWPARMAQGLEAVQPADAGRLRAILHRFEQTAPDTNAMSCCVLHGDFSMNQVLLDGLRVSIVDFDDVGVGDACADIGTFVARLGARVADESVAREVAAVLRRDYEDCQDVALDDSHLRWFEALACTRLGLSALSQLKPGWRLRMHAHWRRASKLLDANGS